MKIIKSELIRTAYTPSQLYVQPLPEIAVVGRSNAGKSSLINQLCNNAKLAKVSQQPGKTRSINYFLINDSFMLVDLPGYGFAKRSGAEQQSWKRLIEKYLQTSEQLAHLLLLCDIRHDIQTGDKQMVEWLNYYGIPYTLVATKCDKIAKSKRKPQAQKLAKQALVSDFLPFSAVDGYGKDLLLERLDQVLCQI